MSKTATEPDQVVAAFDSASGELRALSRAREPDTLPQDNGCFNTLEWAPGGWAVLAINQLPDG